MAITTDLSFKYDARKYGSIPPIKKPTTVIIDDIFSDKPYTKKDKSMSIFKFTTVKPSALKIWTTLIDTSIHPREGYTEDQIRYRMFICLQLTIGFKTMVTHCNAIIDSDKYDLKGLLSDSCTLTSCTESDFSDLSVISQSFPHWVSSELYTPYYLTKQLCHKLNNDSLLGKLFDRDSMSPKEIPHWNIDCGNQPGLTAYKMYNEVSPNDLLQWVNISYNRPAIEILSREDITPSIIGELLDSIEVSDNFILPKNAKTTIPYFILKA